MIVRYLHLQAYGTELVMSQEFQDEEHMLVCIESWRRRGAKVRMSDENEFASYTGTEHHADRPGDGVAYHSIMRYKHKVTS